jgi:hypothetical protein
MYFYNKCLSLHSECLTNQLFTLIKKTLFFSCYKRRVMVFNSTFNNISVLSWQSILFVEETGVPGKNPATSHCQTLSHKVVSSTPHHD